jgi:glycosyl transferase family 1
MRVMVMPADPWACGHYRVIWPADVLRTNGYDVTIIPPSNNTGFRIKVSKDPATGEETLLDAEVPDVDLIVIQRPAKSLMTQLIQFLRTKGIAVVVEIDDDLTNLHHRNIAYRVYQPGNSTGLSWRHTIDACKAATYVVTTTKRLQHVFARHGRGMAIDNYVPKIYMSANRSDTGFFGWAGTVKSHPDDLQVTGHAVPILLSQGFRFQALGGNEGLQDALRLDRPVPAVPGVPLEAWASTMANCFDVAMCPLTATAFNQAKSRLKAIEAMAVGLAWVASPRDEYRRLHKESGTGLLADTPKQWVNHIKALMSNDSMRQEHIEAGIEYMKTQTYEANAWRWWEAWTEALKIQREGQ